LSSSSFAITLPLDVVEPSHSTSSSCGWRRRPPDMEGSCKCVE